jgi:hypothetical protein
LKTLFGSNSNKYVHRLNLIPEQSLDIFLKMNHKSPAAFTDLDTLLAESDLFFAIAAIRNDLGPDIFCRVLSAGKHLNAGPDGCAGNDLGNPVLTAERTF